MDYVDILLADVYNNDYEQSHRDQLVELIKGKVIALDEIEDLWVEQGFHNSD